MSELPKGKLEFQDPLFRKGATESGLRKVEESIRAANEAPLRARIAELEGRLYRARDAVAAAGQREAWMVEVLTHAETWMSEDGCDCGTDEPGTCALCEAQAIISSPRSPTAQALARLVEAVGAVVRNGGYLSPNSGAMRDLEQRYSDLCDARSGRGGGK